MHKPILSSRNRTNSKQELIGSAGFNKFTQQRSISSRGSSSLQNSFAKLELSSQKYRHETGNFPGANSSKQTLYGDNNKNAIDHNKPETGFNMTLASESIGMDNASNNYSNLASNINSMKPQYNAASTGMFN